MVTGPVTKNMREALERTYHAVPNPKMGVVAIGGLAAVTAGVLAGRLCRRRAAVSEVIPVDLHIPGCPPTAGRQCCKVCWAPARTARASRAGTGCELSHHAYLKIRHPCRGRLPQGDDGRDC